MTEHSGSRRFTPQLTGTAPVNLTENSPDNAKEKPEPTLSADAAASGEALSDLVMMDALGMLGAEDLARFEAMLNPEDYRATVDRARLHADLKAYHRLISLIAAAASASDFGTLNSASDFGMLNSAAMPSPAVKDKVMARLAGKLPGAASAGEGTEVKKVLTELSPVQPVPETADGAMSLFQTVRSNTSVWQSVSADGMDMQILSHDKLTGQAVLLLRGAAGASFPAHHHTQPERCYMISGSVRIGDLRLEAGDYHYADAGSSHERLVAETPALALLVACAKDYLPLLSRRKK